MLNNEYIFFYLCHFFTKASRVFLIKEYFFLKHAVSANCQNKNTKRLCKGNIKAILQNSERRSLLSMKSLSNVTIKILDQNLLKDYDKFSSAH